MSKLIFKDKPVVGLDISSTGIKVMSINQRWSVVTGYGSLDLEPIKIKEALENSSSYLSDNIKTLIKERVIGNLPSNHIAISIPTARTYSRTFSLPSNVSNSLKDAVDLEVDQYIPLSRASLYVDFKVIEKTKTSINILMSAVPKTLIDNCISAAENAGLNVCLIEPSMNSVARLLTKTEDGHLPSVVVDIGPASTDIAILDGGIVRVTGGTAIGGNTFTIDIARKLGVELENAHQLKVLNGLNAGPKQDKIKGSVEPSLKRISTEIRKVMRYYNERMNSEVKIEQLLIVGSGSNMPGIGEYFTNELILPSRVASPWQKLDFGKLPEPVRQFRPRYITVAGLASINPGDIWK
ncbi:MAG: pilus assembly protein PilM [Candidatus Saccharimonadaceae bacterium]|nr:pilus assembly protein PilM [Candidatus Saccharimonadaceae bacterium]